MGIRYVVTEMPDVQRDVKDAGTHPWSPPDTAVRVRPCRAGRKFLSSRSVCRVEGAV